MSFHDPISDLLTRIRNAQSQSHRYVDAVLSKQCKSLAEVMSAQGFVGQILVNEEKRKLRIFLKYDKQRKPVVQGLKRLSKPGLRRYVKSQDIPKVLGGMGIAILSTPKGILEGEAARENKVGGEILCCIW
jgi:small subunit ribosomal protein S8